MKLGNPYLEQNSAIFDIAGRMVSISIEEIDAETAYQYLQNAAKNRASADRNSEVYAIDVAAGKWQLTGETIVFNDDGELIDGNGRLKAVVKAKKSIRAVVVRGIDDKAALVMDSGKSRTAVDVVEWHFNVSYAKTLAYMLKRIVLINNGDVVSSSGTTTRTEEMAVMRKYGNGKELETVAQKVHSLLQPNQKKNLMAFLSWCYGRKFPTKVEAFLTTLGNYGKDGYVADNASPIHQLAKAFELGKYNGSKINRDREQRLAVAAFNMYLGNKRGVLAPAVSLKLYGTDISLDGDAQAKAAAAGD